MKRYTSFTLGGLHSADFTVSGPPPPITLSSGATITAGVRVSPSAVGPRNGILQVASNGFPDVQKVSLSATGNDQADIAVSLGATNRPSNQRAYTIYVLNGGPALAKGIVVSDPLPVGTVFVSAASSQGSCLTPAPGANGVMTCSLGTLAAGAQATVSLVIRFPANGNMMITNTVTVKTVSPDPNVTNNSATF